MKPRYADAVFSCGSVTNLPGMPSKHYTDEMIETAMSDAVKKGISEGVSMESPEMRKRMMAARKRVKNAPV